MYCISVYASHPRMEGTKLTQHDESRAASRHRWLPLEAFDALPYVTGAGGLVGNGSAPIPTDHFGGTVVRPGPGIWGTTTKGWNTCGSAQAHTFSSCWYNMVVRVSSAAILDTTKDTES